MDNLKEVLKEKTIRDKKDGEEYEAEKLQKKVGISQYMLYKDAMLDTIFIITKKKIYSAKVDEIDKEAIFNSIKSQLKTDQETKKLTKDFLWFRKGDSARSVLVWITNFLRFKQ